jgi:hypothetical protein
MPSSFLNRVVFVSVLIQARGVPDLTLMDKNLKNVNFDRLATG